MTAGIRQHRTQVPIEQRLQNEIDETAGQRRAEHSEKCQPAAIQQHEQGEQQRADHDDAAWVGEIDDPHQQVCVASNVPANVVIEVTVETTRGASACISDAEGSRRDHRGHHNHRCQTAARK